MRMVGAIADEGAARRLVDYLLTLEIPSEARPNSGSGWGVWIFNEDHVERGRQELDAFLKHPDAPKYRTASGVASQLRQEAQRADRAHRKNTIDLRGRLDRISPYRCPVTYALIALSVLVAVFSNVGDNRAFLAPLYFSPPTTVESDTGEVRVRSARLEPIKRGELWRLWTSMFIHYGWVHLIFNMSVLYRFGGMIELRKNSWVMLGLVLFATPITSLAEYVWDLQSLGPNEIALPGGMSGVVYALFGYVWMKSDYEPDSHIQISNNTVMFMLAWLVLCMTGFLGEIANAAHLSGLIYGMCVGLAPQFLDRGPEPE